MDLDSKSKLRLTIGMAVYDDLQGLAFTIQGLRLMQAECMSGDCEILVIDNNPTSDEGTRTKGFCAGIPNARYIAAGEVVGTSAPRDRVFREARGDIVICMDAHVIPEAGAIGKLLAFADANPESQDLWQGPLLYDNLLQVSTHFAPGWRDEMWGTWDTDPRINQPPFPATTTTPAPGFAETPGGKRLIADGPIPPFEIPMQGLGLFACRKSAWPGFNPAFRQFGGEEGYIHQKFRNAGRKTLCLPFLRWWHYFGRARTPYPTARWHKVRNYFIGWKEVGLPVEEIHAHFVLGKQADGKQLDPSRRISQADWDAIAAGDTDPPAACTTCGGVPKFETLEAWYERIAATPSDINEHAAKLRELASQCDRVTEFGMRHGVSTVALLAGVVARGDGLFTSIDLVRPAEAAQLSTLAPDRFAFRQGNSLEVEIEETDLLFIDTKHTGDQIYGELTRHAPKVRKWIAMHDTNIYGEVGEDGKPGLLSALRAWLKLHSEWTVIYHVQNNYGFTVISRDPADKPALPGKIQMAVNFAAAMAAHVADGLVNADAPTLEYRLEICTLCPSRNGDNCSVCGCPLAKKAAIRSSECPLGKWQGGAV